MKEGMPFPPPSERKGAEPPPLPEEAKKKTKEEGWVRVGEESDLELDLEFLQKFNMSLEEAFEKYKTALKDPEGVEKYIEEQKKK